jgi:predicted transcriptional regulator
MQNTKNEVVVSGAKALKIADSLNATTFKILQMLGQECLDVSTISRRLELSEAYTSEQVRALEDLNLISVSYERGKRGIRKICKTPVQKITILLNSSE